MMLESENTLTLNQDDFFGQVAVLFFGHFSSGLLESVDSSIIASTFGTAFEVGQENP
jgi:hypothetical protein